MTKRIAPILLPVLLGVAFAASAATAATPTPVAKYQACLKAHGVVFGSAKQPTAAKMRAAFKACASLAPAGAAPAGGPAGSGRPMTAAQRAAFAKYAACMKKNGVTLSRTARPNTASAKVQAAQKACASLRPQRPGG
jgi:hypothetical protein